MKENFKYRSDKLIKSHFSCDHCGSSDAASLYYSEEKDQHYIHCFSGICGRETIIKSEEKLEEILERESKSYLGRTTRSSDANDSAKLAALSSGGVAAIKDRGISRETVEKYGVTLKAKNGKIARHIYPYFTVDGEHVANKIRYCEDGVKGFSAEGELAKATLFGQQLFPKGCSRFLTVTEGECFPESAEVLTPQGWVTLRDYQDQKVLQVSETGAGTFVDPLQKVFKFYEGSLIRHFVRGWVSITTPDHNLVAHDNRGRLHKFKAKDIPPKSSWTIPRTAIVNSNGIPLSPEQIQLCIAVSADAAIDDRNSGERYVRFGLKKQRKIDRLRQILSALGIKASDNLTKNDCQSICFTLPEWVPGRELDWDWIYRATSSQREFILKELVEWDGNRVPNRNQVEYSSKYIENAKWVQTLAHTSGYCSSIIERENAYGKWFKVSVLFGKNRSSWQTVKTEAVEYRGLVGCLTVPSGMLLVRQDNKITVSGNCDAMSVYEMSGGKSPAVSIKNGAAAVLKDLSDPDVYDYINSYETIIVAFDSDRAGTDAAKKFCEAFAPGKCRVLEYPDGIKDCNDYLKAGRISDFTKAWWNAKPYAPENIKTFGMLKDAVLNPPDIETYEYPWSGLQEMSYGQRLHEFVVWKADTGVGKTQVAKELEYYNGMHHNMKVGIIHLEEPDHKTGQALVSIYLNTPLHLNIREVTRKEVEDAFDAIDRTGNFYLYDSFGAEDVDAIVSKIRYMVMVLGCRAIVLDHIHMVASDAGESERFKLDELAGKLKKSTMEMPYVLHGIVHTNDEGQTRGTRVIDKLANMIFHLKRDKQATDPKLKNKTEITCEKNRFAGETGVCCYLDYNKITGRMTEGMSPEEEGLL